MRSQFLCGAIAILASAALAGCAPYDYGYGRGNYAYGAYGPYAYAPYGGYPPPPAAYAAPQPLSQASETFVINTALGESYEIEAGDMARQRAASAQIRQFADQVVRGNSVLTQRLAIALQNNGTPVTIPSALDPQHQTMLNDLTMAQGPDFDRRYTAQQLAAHQEAVDMLRNYAQSGDNPALRQFALRALPAAEEGLRLAQLLPGNAGAAPSLAAINPATCHKGLLWPFVREPGDCLTDVEQRAPYPVYPYQ